MKIRIRIAIAIWIRIKVRITMSIIRVRIMVQNFDQTLQKTLERVSSSVVENELRRRSVVTNTETTMRSRNTPGFRLMKASWVLAFPRWKNRC